MKKLAISTLAVLIACPAFAMNHPDQGSSWTMWGMDPYVGLRGGISYTNLNYSYDGNKEAMTEAISMVKTGQVTYAVRDTEFDGNDIHEGDILGLALFAILLGLGRSLYSKYGKNILAKNSDRPTGEPQPLCFFTISSF